MLLAAETVDPLRRNIDADRVLPKLWIGSRPPPGSALAAAGYQILVLCAAELQPKSATFPGLPLVLHAGIRDDRPTGDELSIAHEAAIEVAHALLRDRRVLVTCAMGLNRSAFVVALAVHVLTNNDARSCIELVRSARPGALANRHFVAHLERVCG